MVSAFVERHHEMIQGEISCFDRVVITGSLPDIGHGQAMEAYLRYHKVLLKDCPRWAEPMLDEIRARLSDWQRKRAFRSSSSARV